MRVENKTYYYFEKKDNKDLRTWLSENELTIRKFADMLEISVSYLNAIICGDRPLTEYLLNKFKEKGYLIKLWLINKKENT